MAVSLRCHLMCTGPTQKRTSYQHSVFATTRAIAEHYDTWDEHTIDARQQQLAKAAAGIWKINFEE